MTTTTDNPKHFYFAFGSNLSIEQMQQRCPTSRPIGPALLSGHRIAFAGSSARWNGHGVATIVDDKRGAVPGLLYVLREEDLARLDRYEGHPVCYARRRVWVSSWVDGQRVDALAWTYVKTGERETAPADGYLQIIAEGYEMIDATDEHREALAIAADAPRPVAVPSPVRVTGDGRRAYPVRHVETRARTPVVASAARGLRAAISAALADVDAPEDDTARASVEVSTRHAFDPDDFIGDVFDAIRDRGYGDSMDRAEAFVMDAMTAGSEDADTLIEIARRYVDVIELDDENNPTSDDDLPWWWDDCDDVNAY